MKVEYIRQMKQYFLIVSVKKEEICSPVLHIKAINHLAFIAESFTILNGST